MKRNRAVLSAVILMLSGHVLASEYRNKGYLYLSPVPRSEYVLPQTKFFLVRFEAISPNDITNLPTFIEVTGAASGSHSVQTKIATDGRTVIFEASSSFSNNELATMTLIPATDPYITAVVEPYQYQFMVAGPMLFPPPPPISSGSPAHEEVMKPLFVRSLFIFPDVYNQFRKSV